MQPLLNPPLHKASGQPTTDNCHSGKGSSPSSRVEIMS